MQTEIAGSASPGIETNYDSSPDLWGNRKALSLSLGGGRDRLYFMADSLASLGVVERYRRCRRIRNRIYRESLSRVVLGSGGKSRSIHRRVRDQIGRSKTTREVVSG